ncbi:MAG: PilW family protein [Pseudomonadota bacterium]|nr:PilW family protein [Pseudomonadota bacterium]
MRTTFASSSPSKTILPRGHGRGGFTLIELMFALVIGLFVVAALYNLFTAQVRQFVYQDLQMEMHQNTRLATDMMSRTARLAGYGTNGTTAGAFGYEGVDSSSLPAIISSNGTGPNGSDAITLVSMDPSLVVNTSSTFPPSCASTTLTVDTAALHNAARLAQYHEGELLMCYDYAAIGGFRSFLWPMTADANVTSGELSIGSGSAYADYDISCPVADNLPLVMTCSRAEVVTFYIDNDDSDGIGAGSADHPVLMMDLDFESPDADDVPLVDNVEDIQFAYCLASGSGLTDCSDPAAWVDEIDPDAASDVYMIRISLVVRSSREDLRHLHVGQRPELEGNPASATTDHYFRQVLSTEVAVRNMRIQSLL